MAPCFEIRLADCATGTQRPTTAMTPPAEGRRALKSVDTPRPLRHKILYAFERIPSAPHSEEARAWPHLRYCGAGPPPHRARLTSRALAELLARLCGTIFRKLISQKARSLMEGATRVCAPFPRIFRPSREIVYGPRVDVITGVMVTKIDAVGRHVQRGVSSDSAGCEDLIWAGGVLPRAFGRKLAEQPKADTDPERPH